MAIVSFDYGHLQSGQDTSANGIVNEFKAIREYAPVCVNELMRQGHTLINCTPPSIMTLQQSLRYRIDKANASGSQLHICFHINAFNGQAHGSEIEVASDSGEKYGQSVLNEICKLGFTNRGIKRPNLYITRNTNMPAILIEPFFCDNAEDVRLYNPNSLGLAIAKGVINIIGGQVKPVINIIKAVDGMNTLDLQRFLNRLGVTDYEGKALIEDGYTGKRTDSAKAKAKAILQNILG